jgi:hypothetical protein
MDAMVVHLEVFAEGSARPAAGSPVVVQVRDTSADGKFDNPDVGTLKMISAARRDDDFTIHLTYPLDAFNVAKIGQTVAKFLDGEKRAARAYKVITRASQDLSVQVELA